MRFVFIGHNRDSNGCIDGWVGGGQMSQQVAVWTVGCIGR